MAYHLSLFDDLGLTPESLASLIGGHEQTVTPRLEMLWSYFRNPLEMDGPARRQFGVSAGRGGYRLGQLRGLPDRLFASGHIGPAWGDSVDRRGRPASEIVIENDIGWRVQTMVDYLFGKPLRLVSTVGDESRRRTIEQALEAVWEASGGIALLQDAALLGHVYGHVDLLVRWTGAPGELLDDAEFTGTDGPRALWRGEPPVRIEVIDASRGVPIASTDDYRKLDGYVLHVTRRRDAAGAEQETVTEVFSGQWRQVYVGAIDPKDTDSRLPVPSDAKAREPKLAEQAPNLISPGVVPVVHIQNLSQPLEYEGLSEVEALIPLQDELNTRLSDRASRVTMQSFKMYLAKGLDGFDKAPIRPGTVWQTDNTEASIQAFGGDASSPSEDAHIAEIRAALDKLSGVPPLATGVVQAKIGNLSSENALRLTLQGLLSKTQRKRLTYGRGIERVCFLILTALHEQGVLKTRPEERRVRVEWQDPLPGSPSDEAAAAKVKREVGVPEDRLLAELGYAAGEGQVG